MGIASWILAGCLLGLAATWVRVGGPPGGCVANVGIGLAGALLGGILATVLGFGGLLAWDGRSLTTAVLAALLALLLGRLARGRGTAG